ncbi:hypothetical protein BROUX41_006293 [Berkeleyomyces rouxiae]|uniref:uncharacterized protein n=1 Tax=Berkeleyomyces rouxiae TaxID=2035830 RepID=UPI003B7ECCB4
MCVSSTDDSAQNNLARSNTSSTQSSLWLDKCSSTDSDKNQGIVSTATRTIDTTDAKNSALPEAYTPSAELVPPQNTAAPCQSPSLPPLSPPFSAEATNSSIPPTPKAAIDPLSSPRALDIFSPGANQNPELPLSTAAITITTATSTPLTQSGSCPKNIGQNSSNFVEYSALQNRGDEKSKNLSEFRLRSATSAGDLPSQAKTTSISTYTDTFAPIPRPVSNSVSVSGRSGESSPCPTVFPNSAQALAQAQLTKPMLIKSLTDVKVAITRVLPNATVENCRWLRLNHPFNTFFDAEVDGLPVLVSVGPSDMNNLLRTEKLSLESEAVLLSWISEHQLHPAAKSQYQLPSSPSSSSSAFPSTSDSYTSSPSSPYSPSRNTTPKSRHQHSRPNVLRPVDYHATQSSRIASQSLPDSPMTLTSSHPYKSPSTLPSSFDYYSTIDSDLHVMFPVLLFHGRPQLEMISHKTYNIKKSPWGTAVSHMKPPLSQRERKSVDFQVGGMLQKLARLQSPTGQFGPVTNVLNGPHCQSQFCFDHVQDWTANTWELAFHRLLEGALRDGEDLYVTLPFNSIRTNVERFLPLLRHVTRPSLVCVDAGIDGNTLALRDEDMLRLSPPEQMRMSSLVKDARSRMMQYDEGYRSRKPASMYASAGQPLPDRTIYDPNVTVTGLVDWSICVFGDPLFAEVFSYQPSSDLLQGFNDPMNYPELPMSQNTSYRSSSMSHQYSEQWSGLVEDSQNAYVRILLYECYHAVSRITAQFARPKTANTATEMAARRRLMLAISKLDALDDNGIPIARGSPSPHKARPTTMPPNHRRPSGEMSPAKRPRSALSREAGEGGAQHRAYACAVAPSSPLGQDH